MKKRRSTVEKFSSDYSSTESLSAEYIKRGRTTFNYYKIRLEIIKYDDNVLIPEEMFHDYEHYIIKFKTVTDLIATLKDHIVSTTHTNAIYCDLNVLDEIEEEIIENFPNANFVYTPTQVMDIENTVRQQSIIAEIHNKAHGNAKINYDEAMKEYFWPTMKRDFEKWVNKCEICKPGKSGKTTKNSY